MRKRTNASELNGDERRKSKRPERWTGARYTHPEGHVMGFCSEIILVLMGNQCFWWEVRWYYHCGWLQPWSQKTVAFWQESYDKPKQCINISEVTQSCLTLCNPMDCCLPGSSVYGIFQAIVVEWIAISFSSGSSWPRDWTRVSHFVDRCFTVWATREVNQRHYSADRGLYSQGYDLLVGHSWSWELNHKEGRVPKNLLPSNCGAGEDSWEFLGQQEDQTCQVGRKSTLNTHWVDWCWNWSSSILVIWCKQTTHWKSPWCWERLKAEGKRASEDEMAGWHHQCNGHELGRTLGNGEGQGGLACCSPWGYRVGHDWATEQQEQLKTFLLLVLFVLLVSLGELLSLSLCSQFSKILWCSFF